MVRSCVLWPKKRGEGVFGLKGTSMKEGSKHSMQNGICTGEVGEGGGVDPGSYFEEEFVRWGRSITAVSASAPVST